MCESRACPMAAYDEAVGGSGAGANEASRSEPLAHALRAEFSYVPDIEDATSGFALWHAPVDAAAATTLVARAQTRCARLYKAGHRGWRGDDAPTTTHPVAFYERALAYASALVPAATANGGTDDDNNSAGVGVADIDQMR